jgi:hypothetical protein
MNYGAQAFEIRRVESLLTVALRLGRVVDQRAYEQARRSYCVRYGLPYVAPISPRDRRIAS